MEPERYFALDIEADGPYPGGYSMLSFGFSVAGVFDGIDYVPETPTATTFYRELMPISKQFDPEALAVSGLDRDRLYRMGATPSEAMTDLSSWVRSSAGEFRPILVAWPLSYDWLWYYYYMMRFVGNSPFSFSKCLDMKTMAADILKKPLHKVGKGALTAFLRKQGIKQVEYPHTHNALDDAVGTAELFSAIMKFRTYGRLTERKSV